MLLIDDSRQSLFAKLSGDHNPLHIDATQARRSQFGGCVVHGVHLVLAALESLEWNSPCTILSLDAQFRAAVMVGEVISFMHEPVSPTATRIAVCVGSQVRTLVSVELQPVESIGAVAYQSDWPTISLVRLGLEELTGHSGKDRLAVDPDTYSALFPSLIAFLRRIDLAGLLATTRVVGMQCPGQWALFRRLFWQGSPSKDVPATSFQEISYHVASIDKRFSMITVAMEVVGAKVLAEVILRQPPPAQVDLRVVRSVVAPDEFIGVRALIVGGSRGLGELAAKVLAAGGAEVLITYLTGSSDANRVVTELGGMANPVQFCVNAPDPLALDRIISFAPTHISYFATPIIIRRPPSTWDPQTFERFIGVYVTGLSRLLASVNSTGKLQSVFFPSSSFIDEQPVGFAEYITAKTAGEVMCAAWHRIHPQQRVGIERLPPMLTDQTSAQLNADPIGNLDIILPLLRRIVG